MKILLIDNYDSFTFNLYHYLSSLKAKVDVVRNDKITSKEIIKKRYNKIVISPGPGNPNQSGNCLNILKTLHKDLPFLGVCLGHQIIGQVFGSKIVQAKKLMHGKTSKIISKKIGILKNLPKSFEATRYHSLIIEKKSLTDFATIIKSCNIEDRKSFALEAIKCENSSILFSMLNKKDYSNIIWKIIYPTYTKPFKNEDN